MQQNLWLPLYLVGYFQLLEYPCFGFTLGQLRPVPARALVQACIDQEWGISPGKGVGIQYTLLPMPILSSPRPDQLSSPSLVHSAHHTPFSTYPAPSTSSLLSSILLDMLSWSSGSSWVLRLASCSAYQ